MIETIIKIERHIPILKYSWATELFNKRTGNQCKEFRVNRL